MTNENKMTLHIATAMPPQIVSNIGESMARMDNNASITDFLHRLTGGAENGHLVICEKPTWASRRFGLVQIADAAAYVADRARTCDVYLGFGLQKDRDARGRGKEVDIVSFPGFFVDMDTREGEHAVKNLPANTEEVLGLVAKAGLPEATLVNHTGGGLHLLWLFKRPIIIASKTARNDMRRLSKAWQAKLRRTFEAHGYHLDATADLTRVVRIPGTWNHKTDPAKPVRLLAEGPRLDVETARVLVASELSGSSRRASTTGFSGNGVLAEFEGLDLAGKQQALNVANACRFVGHCIGMAERGEEIPEPQWKDLADILAHLGEAGDRLFHLISQRDPRYRFDEAQQKLEKAREFGNPKTCARIGEAFSGCAECTFRMTGRLRNPCELAWGEEALLPIQRAWLQDSKTGLFLNSETGAMKQERDFDRSFAYRGLGDKPCKTFQASELSLIVDGLDYRPGASERVIEENGQRFYNQWTPGGIEPAAGDCSTILEHFRLLFPNPEEHDHVTHYIAHLVRKPTAKINHAILLRTEQGLGKSMLEGLFRKLLGPENVRVAPGQEITDKFNAKLGNNQLLILEELDVLEKATSYNQLKLWITSELQSVEDKYVSKFDVRTPRGIFLFTNRDFAIRIEKGDRRLMVLRNVAERREPAYYAKLAAAIEDDGQVAAFRAHLDGVDLSAFDPKRPAPMTAAKQQLELLSSSVLEQHLIALRSEGEYPFDCNLFTLEGVGEVLKAVNGREPNRNQVSELVRALGGQPLRRVSVHSKKKSFWCWRDQERYMAMSHDEIATEWLSRRPPFLQVVDSIAHA